MEKDHKASGAEKISSAVCIALLFVFLACVFYSFFTKQAEKASSQTHLTINWSKSYPFSDSGEEQETEKAAQSNPLIAFVEWWDSFVYQKQRHFEKYYSTLLPGYQNMAEMAQAYNKLVRWNYVSDNEYNGVVELDGGYLAGRTARIDVSEHIEAVKAFREKCREAGSEFLYIVTPSKVCEYEDEEFCSTASFCNQNASELLAGLRAAGVETLDLRASLHSQGMNHHDTFYRTDHHWKTTAAPWAAREIMEKCNEAFGFGADLSLLEDSAFEQELYPEWFLGSQGKKVTLSRAVPDDFVLLHPTYETNVHFAVPTRAVDVTGSFEVMYDMSEVIPKDYYVKNPYGAYSYAEEAVTVVENLNNPEGKKVLLIRDSMSDCVIPVISMCLGELRCLDLRNFTGSVWEYFQEYSPDAVLVMYGASSIESINWNYHKDKFDFR